MNDLINRKKLLDDIDNLTFHATLSFPLKASKIYEIKSVIQKLLDSIIEIIKNSPSESGWIPCSERLPENNEIVLCLTKEIPRRVLVLSYLECRNQFGTYTPDYFSHWMHIPDLPEPPKEGDNDA